MNTIGKSFRITIFGESHGSSIGCTIDGLPSGFAPDFELIRAGLARRSPSGAISDTSRRERDDFEILSGFYNERLTGAPFTVVFKNKDVVSDAYLKKIARPSHADYTAYVKYSGYNDPRGGGMFSGRMTTPLVFAGELARQILLEQGIHIVSHISRIGDVRDTAFDPLMDESTIPRLDPTFPLVNPPLRAEMEALFSDAYNRGTTCGGTVECAIVGLPAGVGQPFFDSVESVLSHMLFSIPAVHGVEFGAGFDFARMDGLNANDPFDKAWRTRSNHSGGVNGGISNGMPVIVRVCFRPVPTVRSEQGGMSLENGETIPFSGNDRHDICILPRGCVVIECACAAAVYDLVRSNQ